MKKGKTPVRYSRKRAIVLILFIFALAMAFVCLFVGSSNMSVKDCVALLAEERQREQYSHSLEHKNTLVLLQP
ncbi:MAG: hypothetical protein ACOX04_07920 [Candidatus Scatomorpha sp.]